MKFKLVVSVLMATLLVACDGGNTTSPSSVPTQAPSSPPVGGSGPTPTPTSTPAVNQLCLVGDLIQPLVNATVGLTSGEVIAVAGNGCASIPAGQTVDYAEAPSFRRLMDFPTHREDVALPEGTYALWPVNGYLEHLEELDEMPGGAVGYPSFSGYRPKSGLYTVSLPSEMASVSSADQNAYRTAMDLLLLDASIQASNKIILSVATSGTANIRVVVDPGGYTGSFEATFSGRYITGGTLKIKSLDVLINDPATVRHELGHLLGVGHVIDDPNKLMYRSPQEFAYATEPEIVHFRMRFLRPAGFDARKG